MLQFSFSSFLKGGEFLFLLLPTLSRKETFKVFPTTPSKKKTAKIFPPSSQVGGENGGTVPKNRIIFRAIRHSFTNRAERVSQWRSRKIRKKIGYFSYGKSRLSPGGKKKEVFSLLPCHGATSKRNQRYERWQTMTGIRRLHSNWHKNKTKSKKTTKIILGITPCKESRRNVSVSFEKTSNPSQGRKETKRGRHRPLSSPPLDQPAKIRSPPPPNMNGHWKRGKEGRLDHHGEG